MKDYQWVYDLGGDAPNFIEAGLKLLGIVEGPGTANNPKIVDWAKEIGIDRTYGRNDSVPWCGLFAAVVIHRAGYTPVQDPLWALNWLNFGQPADQPSLGDVMVWRRHGGGHVNFYVAEDEHYWHCLGGNQHDSVNISRFPKRGELGALILVQTRRPKWKIGQPKAVKPYLVETTGQLCDKVV